MSDFPSQTATTSEIFHQFSMNDKVKVKLNRKGREVMQRYESQIAKWIMEKSPEPKIHLLPISRCDQDGWSQFLFWEVMMIFGPHITHAESPFETTEIRLIKG
jgi:hypothetical protein